ncbi:homoserine dehydrogenase-domain-containing protein [Crepidotus variabilis]|uniref:Homoserine dehydrogenase n=1 Tax=Crepidotus variabilis TaxID=179855 RepID=A0A9P6EJE5_9AGAR|nr:homoserine dehydrogenase-domain-containing protein [Crepidotus variabilis]
MFTLTPQLRLVRPTHRLLSTMTVSQKPLLVAVVGVGLVGSEFIQQLLSIPTHSSPFKLISLSSSSRTLFTGRETPIDSATSWKSKLAGSSSPADLADLTNKLLGLVKNEQERVAIVDNTSSENVAGMYPSWLQAGIHVVTPNKKAFSGDRSLYEEILAASRSSGAKFLNEATVGAGLPVIAPLKEILATGDRVIKIEGVFSGTMSYIFNEFSTAKSGGPSFSSVVSVARDKGYTEPHPADDLNGYDVARKLTILSRQISAASVSSTLPELQSFLSVQTQSLIPSPLESTSSGDEFIQKLPEHDAHFSATREAAAKENSVLRYVGVIDTQQGVVKAGLEKYPLSHPFATSLGGSDNIIMFHTERYSPRPLIIQGAGAGAAVTAMGVLGDLLKLV